MSPFVWLVVFAFLIHINIQNAIDRIKDNVPKGLKKTLQNAPFWVLGGFTGEERNRFIFWRILSTPGRLEG